MKKTIIRYAPSISTTTAQERRMFAVQIAYAAIEDGLSADISNMMTIATHVNSVLWDKLTPSERESVASMAQNEHDAKSADMEI